MGDELLLVGVDILPVQGGPFGLLLRGQALGTLALLASSLIRAIFSGSIVSSS